MTKPGRRPRGRPGVSPWPFVGMAGMACAFFLYGASGLVAPWWAVIALVVIWLLLLLVACAWWTPHPRWVPGVAVFAVVFWFVAITAGGVFLGWTA